MCIRDRLTAGILVFLIPYLIAWLILGVLMLDRHATVISIWNGTVQDVYKRQDMMYQLYFNPETGRAKNLVKSAATLDELAALINVPAEALKATVETYNKAVDGEAEDEFGRSFDATPSAYSLAVNKIEGDKYYAIPLKALVVMTLGGVSIDTQAHVLDESGTVIPGLYACLLYTSVIQFGQMEPLALQSLFDEILPGLLPLCITWATAWLLKKQVNMLHIMIGMFILGIVCNVIGIL